MTEFLEADDDFDELYDVIVPRVDLVGKGANGMPILIAKSAAGQTGLISQDTIHQLLKGAPMPSPIRKAKGSSSQVAVYDANGNLVGTIDESDLNPIADASAPRQSGAPQAAPVAQAPVQQAEPAEQVAKSISGALRGATYSNVGPVMKGAGPAAVDGRFDALMKSVDVPHRAGVQSAVALGAIQLGTSYKIPSHRAIQMAKKIALDIGGM